MKLIIYLIFLLPGVLAEPLVETSLGTVRGIVSKVSGINVESFLAIPFAKPPVGELRFALPLPFGNIGDFNASQISTICPQEEAPVLKDPLLIQNEDCLKLNIYRKAEASTESKKPVVIIVHGGGFAVGSGSDKFQTAIALAGYEDVIIVSPNYRLGVLGFADMKDLAPGNLGLHDQRLAFQWVHENIEAFGGDPKKVTLMGVSAGSMSVAAHIVSPLTRDNHFQSVIMDAGVVNSYSFIDNPDNSFKQILQMAELVNCPTDGFEMLKCLREIDAQKLVKLSNAVKPIQPAFTPTRDGIFLPRNLEEYLKEDIFANVRVIIGYSRNEGSLFSTSVGDFATEDEFLKKMELLITNYEYPIDLKDSNIKKQLVERYFEKYPGHANASAEIQGDGIFICPSNYFVKQFAKQHNNIFVYEFNRKLKQTYFGMFDPAIFGAFHYAPYMHFSGAALAQTDVEVPPMDEEFFLDAMRMVSNFIRTDDAPVLRGVTWPDYSITGEILHIDETPRVKKGLTHDDNCEVFFAPSATRKPRTEL